MRSWGLWLLCFVLWDASLTVTAVNVYKRPKGGKQTVTCWSNKNVNVTRRVFCKNDCEEGDILVQTSGSGQTKGRYRIKHEKKGSPPVDFIKVTISNLTLSDSGRYRCFWDSPVQSEYSEFRIEVTDGADAETKAVVPVTAGEDFSHSCLFHYSGQKKSFCRNVCSEEDILVMTMGDEGQSGRYKIQYKKYGEDLSYVTVSIKNVNIADSGAYQCRLDKNSKEIWIDVAPGGPPQTQKMTVVHVLDSVCVAFIITAATVTICCRRRTRTAPGTGAGAGPNPERQCENVHPESENIY